MKFIYFTFIFLFIYSCVSDKTVYWCGDHPCVNKKEKEEYFKKKMIVEVKNIKDVNKNEYSNVEKMTSEAKIEQKKRIKEEKRLAKKLELEEKRRIKEEKRLAKKIKSNNRKKEQKRSNNDEKKIVLSSSIGKLEVNLSKFNDLVDKIRKKNSLRPYPDINDIPN